MLDCTEDELIHFAAKGIIDIAVPVGNAVFIKEVIDPKSGRTISTELGGGIQGGAIKLSAWCVRDYESGMEGAEAVLAIYFKGREDGNTEVLKLVNKDTGKPLLIKDAKLVVFNEDIDVLKGSESHLAANERSKLLKQIASLALLLAEKSNKYKRGEKPNALSVASDVGLIFDAFEFEGKRGAGSSELRDSIASGVKLLLGE